MTESANVCRTARDPDGNLHVNFWCPACQLYHGIIDMPKRWSWNGSLTRPTIEPSILVWGTVPVTDEEISRILAGEKIEPIPLRCHSHVVDGEIRYCDDCSHDMAGQTVPMVPLTQIALTSKETHD